MKIYNYHPQTLEFLGEGIADADPLDEGNWLIPACATITPPPASQDGKTCFFVGDAWVLQDQAAPVVPPVVSPTPEQITAALSVAIQKRLDDFARTRNYDSILSACTYVNSSVPKFHDEGQACVNLRDATWAASYDILAQVQGGQRPMPSSIADIEDDLPTLAWPAA